MKILSIETSCDIASLSILENEKLILEVKSKTLKSHSETLMPLLDTLLCKTSISLDDIDLFTCDNGPRFIYWNKNRNCNYKSNM